MTSDETAAGTHSFEKLTGALPKEVITTLAAAFDNPALLTGQGFERLGASLPRDLSLDGFVVETRPPALAVDHPGPGWVPQELVLTMCRRYWVKKPYPAVGFEQVEVCRGFRVVANPLTGGPIAR